MLLPVQLVLPVIGTTATTDTTQRPAPLPQAALVVLESELSYWLTGRTPRTRWVTPESVVRAAAGAPALAVRPRELPVQDFLRASLQSIGDPLYGDLRKLGILVDARVALLPIGAVWVPELGGGGRVHIAAALIDTFGGNVLWYGVVAGDTGSRSDAGTAASAAQALAQVIPR